MSNVWNGQARPRRGTKPRRLEHPERARWLLYPDGTQYQAPKDEPPDAAELEAYARAWDRVEEELDREARIRRQAEVDAKWEAELRHRAVEDMRIGLSAPARRVQDRLREAPQHYAVWWERLEAWLDKNPPGSGHGSAGDPERKIDEYDVFLKERSERREFSKRGWPRGRRHSEESKSKMRETRRLREEEGTWGRRGPTLKRQFKPKTYEELAEETE